MPICANDAADIASSKSANSSERMEETIRIVIPFLLDRPYAFPVLLHDCGLRGLKGTISGRHALLEDYVSLAIVLTETLSFRRCRGLSKNAHFQQVSPWDDLPQRRFLLS
jgi:hypothetical protein